MMLGNLNLDQMQKRTGVNFPEELIKLMQSTRQEEAQKIQSGFWHCFDIPFMLVCGNIELAQEIYDYLKPITSDFTVPMQIGVEK